MSGSKGKALLKVADEHCHDHLAEQLEIADVTFFQELVYVVEACLNKI